MTSRQLVSAVGASTLAVCVCVLTAFTTARTIFQTFPTDNGSAERTAPLFTGNDSISGTNKLILCEQKVRSSIDEFPPDFFTEDQRRHGAVIVHLFVTFYGFLMITIVCQDYFVPSVFRICTDLSVPPDVAGATFMATATCTSELIVSAIDTFLTETDLGVGTVVGSGVYNALAVPACAGLAAGRAVPIDKWPLLRDSAVYATSVAVLAAFAADNVIEWHEALVMVAAYSAYLLFMFARGELAAAASATEEESTGSFSTRIMVFIYIKKTFLRAMFWRQNTSAESQNLTIHESTKPTCDYGSVTAKHQTAKSMETTMIFTTEPDQTISNVEVFSRESHSGTCLLTFWEAFCLPAKVMLSKTVPNCQTRQKWYPLTFIMSAVWISAITYVVSWMLTICGDTFRINDVVMGVGVLALGSSIPEIVSGIINAKNGEGSMSISGALGSNTMDVLLCLGAPWFVKTCVLPASAGGGPVVLETDSLFVGCGCMIAAVVALNAAAAVCGYVMHRPFGCACLVALAAVVAALMVNGMNATAVGCWDARSVQNGGGRVQ